MLFSRLEIPLNVIVKEANLILLGVAPYYEYADGKKTDIIAGYRYNVVEDANFEKFSVKIASSEPIITQKEIDASTARLYVQFDNAFAKPYQSFSGSYDLSFSATGVSFID